MVAVLNRIIINDNFLYSATYAERARLNSLINLFIIIFLLGLLVIQRKWHLIVGARLCKCTSSFCSLVTVCLLTPMTAFRLNPNNIPRDFVTHPLSCHSSFAQEDAYTDYKYDIKFRIKYCVPKRGLK
jgi:hypothetical protein